MQGVVMVTAVFLVAACLVGLWLALAGWSRTLEARLGVADSELKRLADAAAWREDGTSEMRRQMSAFRESMDQLQVREHERRARDEESWRTLQRVASVLAGSQRTGRVGENVLREALGHLPPSMVVTDFRVNGRVVEFGLVLPDGRRLAIDSKWTAERELQALAESTDPEEREKLVRTIEREVSDRAREVACYLDPSITAPVAVAAVPDAAYEVLRRAHAQAYRLGVIVIPYSMALPVLLFLYGIVSRFGAAVDVEACLADMAASLDSIEATVENKVARAVTMLANGEHELRGQVGKARTALVRARETAREAVADPVDPERPALIGLAT